jgi:type II secretory pathway pseudopilin PulG
MKKNQKGYGIVELLLVIVLVGIFAFAGWYILDSNKTADTSLSSAEAVSSSTAKNSKALASAKDSTADWITYSSQDGQYMVKYPKSWATATHPELCTSGLLLLGANSKSVGSCGSENFGQISIWSLAVSGQVSQGLNRSGYMGVTKKAVTVNGIAGSRESATASGQASQPGGLSDGTKVVDYIFTTNNRVYALTYVQNVSYPDALSDFDLMVTKTFQFHP